MSYFYYSHNTMKQLIDQPADLAPFGYLWRRDRAVQEKPEADFIPRRIKRQDEVYRTALDTMGPEMTKSIHYNQPDLLEKQLPKAKGELLTGLLWVGGITDYTVELVWPEDAAVPSQEAIEVRTYPTAWGWFGFSVDKRLENPVISANGRRWQYPCPADQTMDLAYNARVKAATEMVAVFAEVDSPIPEIHITGESLGTWKELTFTVEWGWDPTLPDFEGEIDAHMALVGEPIIDKAAKRATYTCLYSSVSRYGNDSRFTCVTDREDMLGATVLLRDLAEAPICVPEAGLFFCPADQTVTAADYITAQKERGNLSIRDMVRTHEEIADWQELLQKVRLWRCPDGTAVPEFPAAPAPAAIFHVPDQRWEGMYELAVEQLCGAHMWGSLAFEVARVTLSMELLGLYKEADRIYDYFLESPGIKSDGDYSTGAGSLEWAKSMRHDMGYNHEGTHCSTGKLLFSMMYRYYLTENKEWLDERLPRLKQAADWIIGELHNYMQDTPNREKLHCYGLMPPCMLGDYALPACDWRWYYCDNAFSQMGLSCLADVLEKTGDADAAYYKAEAARYEDELMAAVKREALYAPVRKSRDGLSRSFIPRMAYAGGLLHYGEETNIPQFAMGINDLFQGALPLGEIFGLMDANDRRMVGTVNAMEEAGMEINVAALEQLDHPTANAEDKEINAKLQAESAGQQRTAEIPTEDLWFYNTFSNLPKISHNANVYLRQDDIENFLRFFLNHAIVMVGTNGKLWEHAHPDVFVPCENPDNGTAAWFAETFRNMLVTEDNGILWLMKGTPRIWLMQGQTVEAQNVPSLYGQLTYTVTSDVENRKIHAIIQVPDRRTPPMLKLRLRHPDKAKIKSVTINGKPVNCIDPDGETISLMEPAGQLTIEVTY